MNPPLINILTRTSNRPNFFDINKTTINTQTYKNIKHIVSVDNEETFTYVSSYDDVKIISINREKIIENDNSVNPNTGIYSPHNLYFNEMLKNVEDGWIMFLDDDDRFSTSQSLEKIVNLIDNEDTLFIWQMRFPNGKAIPTTETINNKPSIGNIGSPCILFHSKYLKNIEWDGWKCGDFRFIKTIYDIIPNKKTIPEMLVTIGQIGNGDKKDL